MWEWARRRSMPTERNQTKFTRAYWSENWDRTIRDYEDHQTVITVALIVLGLLGYGAWFDSKEAAQLGLVIGGGFLALNFLVFTPWAMWEDSRKEIARFRDQLKAANIVCVRPGEHSIRSRVSSRKRRRFENPQNWNQKR